MDIFKDKDFIKKLNNDLKNGAVIAFVTDTVWGIGCLPSSKKGVNRIYTTKGRDRTKPLILMSDKIENLLPYTKEISPQAQVLIEKYFPGALTVISEKSDKTPNFMTSGMPTVGIRIPNNKFFQTLCSHIEGGTLATTSANISSQPSAKSYEEACCCLNKDIDYIFNDYGFCCKGLESTVVLAMHGNIKILRQGAILL